MHKQGTPSHNQGTVMDPDHHDGQGQSNATWEESFQVSTLNDQEIKGRRKEGI
jgi:hypothetical protein